ncbi:MADS box transcription factor [Lithospermum erythrorhizon]|uniref:MADS box transcription factor n=1 Tax=Lithospermum erythrorhizon TaxID=34254 RepID=A0AAV3PQB0_LITER
MERKGKGRKKISMKKIENESHLQVTFSKRRAGLFKKASELCILCDAQVAIIVFSPGNKVYSFGHPSVGSTINKYLTNTNIDNNFADFMLGASQSLTLQELNMDVTNVEKNLAMEKDKGKQLNDLKRSHQGYYWWDVPNKDQLTLEQLEMLKKMMERLLNNVQIEKQRLSFEANNYMGEAINVAPTSIDTLDGMGYVHSQHILPFDPRPFPGSTIPYEYRVVNDFGHGFPNSHSQSGQTIWDNHPSFEARTNEINPTIPFDPSAGPSGTNTYGSTQGHTHYLDSLTGKGAKP